jgi:tRNA(His) 5'-end guanylyltransferase
MNNETFAKRMRSMQQSSDFRLPKKNYTILQLDGKAFRTWTKGLDTPFDTKFVEAMDGLAELLTEKIPNVKLAYVQSDEVNLVLTDFENENSEPYYSNRIQKVVSTSAGLASAYMTRAFPDKPFAVFDARFWVAPDKESVKDWFVWRQADGMKNSVRAVGYARFSSKQLMNKNTKDVCEMLAELGDPWEAYDEGLQRGRVVTRVAETKTTTFTHGRSGEKKTLNYKSASWKASAAELFRDGDFLDSVIPTK